MVNWKLFHDTESLINAVSEQINGLIYNKNVHMYVEAKVTEAYRLYLQSLTVLSP